MAEGQLPLPVQVTSDSGSAINISDYSTPTQRASLYQRLSSSSLLPLTEQAAQYYISSTPYTPGTFYPSLFRVAARSLKLTASYFTTQPSSIVPGEQGLFLRRSIPAHRHRIFVGFYLGWTHSEDALAPFTSPDQQGKYSLQLPHSTIVTATPLPDSVYTPFLLARANEWVWDPSVNQLSFDSAGRFFLNPSSTPLKANTEVCVCLGTQGNYSWDHYVHYLYQRLLRSTTMLATMQQRHDWADVLQQHCHISTPQALTLLSKDPTPHLRKVLLAIVEVYAPSQPTATLRIQPNMSLLQWLQSLSTHSEFSNHHTFRKADRPQRPFLHNTLMEIYHSDQQLQPIPMTHSMRPRRSSVPLRNYNEGTDPTFCQDLADQLSNHLPLLYTDADIQHLDVSPSPSASLDQVSLSPDMASQDELPHTPDDHVDGNTQDTHQHLCSLSQLLHAPGHRPASSISPGSSFPTPSSPSIPTSTPLPLHRSLPTTTSPHSSSSLFLHSQRDADHSVPLPHSSSFTSPSPSISHNTPPSPHHFTQPSPSSPLPFSASPITTSIISPTLNSNLSYTA